MDCTRARTHDPTEWIQTCPDFSWPLAERVREWFLEWEPDLSESIKWHMLCFSGRKLVCGLSACKAHLGITFFRGTELPDPAGLFTPAPDASSLLTIRLVTLEGIDRRALRALLHAAVALDADPEAPPPMRRDRPALPVPKVLAAALRRNRKAAESFDALSPSCRREYIVWVRQAVRPETRERRLAETLRALAAGKRWKDRREA
jgi:hypothetical protein